MSRPLRILHIASGDAWGGAETVILQLIAGLSQSGASVEVEVAVLNEGTLCERIRGLGLEPIVIPETQLSFGALRGRIRELIGRDRWDVVHVHRYKELLLSVLAGRETRGRIVLTVHGLEPWSQLSNRVRAVVWTSLWLGRAWRVRFAAVSAELEARLSRLFGRAAVVAVANPLPDLLPEPESRLHEALAWGDETPIVGFVGRLEEVKGPDLLIEIARRSDPRLHFVVIGDGALGPSLKDRVAADPKLRDRVAFLGEVDGASRHFPEFDVLALTSRHEGSPIVVLEAARAGIPVFAFAVGGVPALLAEAPEDWLSPPEDVAAFANALDQRLDRAGRDDATQRWASGLRARHGREAVTNAYLAMYRDCAKRS